MLHIRYLAAAASITATAGLLGACGSSHAPVTRAPGSASPVPTIGLVPAPRQLSDRIVLQRTRVRAGTPIKGTLVVTNHATRPVNLTRGCEPSYAVALTNGRFPPQAAFAADCSTAPFIIKPGVNRFAISVITTYLSCTGRPQATSQTPACLPGDRMPPLPAGRYRAVLVGSGDLALPPPVPVQVVLTSP